MGIVEVDAARSGAAASQLCKQARCSGPVDTNARRVAVRLSDADSRVPPLVAGEGVEPRAGVDEPDRIVGDGASASTSQHIQAVCV